MIEARRVELAKASNHFSWLIMVLAAKFIPIMREKVFLFFAN